MGSELSEIAIFSGLDKEMLEKCSGLFIRQEYEAGDFLCKEGDPGNHCFLIASGEVSVSRLIDPEEHREKILASLKEGDIIGEMTLLEELPRSATVAATVATVAYSISRDDFKNLLHSNSDGAVKLLLAIISTMSGRLRRSSTELIALYDTGKIIGSESELGKLCAAITERLVESLGMEKGLVVLVDEYIPKPELKGSFGFSAIERHGLTLDSSTGLLGHILLNNSPILFNNFSPPEGLSLHGFEAEKMLGVPLVASEKIIGAIILCSTVAEVNLDMNHLNLLVGVSSQVASAIEASRLREEENARVKHDRHFVRY